MTRTKLSGTRIINIKRTACKGLMPVSRICSLSKLIRSRPASESNESISTEKKTPGAEAHQSENYANVMRKTVAFYLPSLIRIRATDREGNSIELMY
jgi:hypothetical protein